MSFIYLHLLHFLEIPILKLLMWSFWKMKSFHNSKCTIYNWLKQRVTLLLHTTLNSCSPCCSKDLNNNNFVLESFEKGSEDLTWYCDLVFPFNFNFCCVSILFLVAIFLLNMSFDFCFVIKYGEFKMDWNCSCIAQERIWRGKNSQNILVKHIHIQGNNF
jgi:hypothetical protein